MKIGSWAPRDPVWPSENGDECKENSDCPPEKSFCDDTHQCVGKTVINI